MKILGLTYYNGAVRTYMKPDSALLVNEKPFFLPDFAERVQMKPCLVARINRLGRNVEERFAHRYYDAWTVGMNIISPVSPVEGSPLVPLVKGGGHSSDVEWIGFDNSLPVGRFVECDVEDVWCLLRNEEKVCELHVADLIVGLDAAIERLTRFVTIRMGDMIAVDFATEWIDLVPEDKWHAIWNEDKILSCKIK